MKIAKKLLDGLPLTVEFMGGSSEPILRVMEHGRDGGYILCPEGGNVSYEGMEGLNKRKFRTR